MTRARDGRKREEIRRGSAGKKESRAFRGCGRRRRRKRKRKRKRKEEIE